MQEIRSSPAQGHFLHYCMSSKAQQLATKLLFLHVLINGCKCYYGFDNNNQSVKSVNNEVTAADITSHNIIIVSKYS